jgi:hypothetical protein
VAFEDSVHRGPRDREQFGQIGDGVIAGLVQGDQVALLACGQFGLLAPELSLGFGHGHPFSGPHPQQVDFDYVDKRLKSRLRTSWRRFGPG